jgi:glycosyltransferase involved in cell wall biosynthesis
MIKAHIRPFWRNADRADGGIRRVVEAQARYFPEFGIENTFDPDQADIMLCHGGEFVFRPGIPMIACNHGLYWHDYDWAAWAHETNKNVMETMRCADAVTAPSKWVAHAIQRNMMLDPLPIYHGVEIDQLEPDPDPADWILWNKARIDPVSDPAFALNLAKMLPNRRFLIVGDIRHDIIKRLSELNNVKVVDPMPYEQMLRYVAKASLYLCTTRETFGIGTLEAMACGVPIVGIAYGGQAEIINQGETGVLVPFTKNDDMYNGLARAIDFSQKNRDRLGANARQDVKERWQWRDKIEQYANLIYETLENQKRPSISVIVTNYNLESYLPDALNSVRNQSVGSELILVDDCSQTDPASTVDISGVDHYLRLPENVGLSEARNKGFEVANGRYIIHHPQNLNARLMRLLL